MNEGGSFMRRRITDHGSLSGCNFSFLILIFLSSLFPFLTELNFCYFPHFHAVARSMSARRKFARSPIVHQPVAQFYDRFVEGIKQRIRTAQIKAALAANAELVLHYWEIGRDITRAFYIRKTVENGWSRSVLIHQIDTNLHKRLGKAPSNFALTLPAPQSDLAREILKDPYIFKPAPLDESATERALEKALLERLRDFLIEMGAGFAFVGNQYRLEVDGTEFFLDLLFYHTRLHCYIVIDLKVVDFEPEFAGKMSFYQAAVDNLVKTPQDAPTIGIILCKGKNHTVVEYTLRDAKSPIGVAEYRLLPPKLKAKLPEAKQLKKLVAETDVPNQS
jgi:predicted nuclease of restriction endonuclease-like (RecB) superfamily